MSILNFACTRRVNPPGVEQVLTIDQVWKGLEMKAYEPKLFLPGVLRHDIIKAEGSRLYRKLTFKSGADMEEELGLYDKTIVYLDSNKGHRITNLISYDEDGGLLLTFSFANGIPGDLAAKARTPSDLNRICGRTLDCTLKKFRELAREGKL